MSRILSRMASVLTFVTLALCVWTLLTDSAVVAARTSFAALITVGAALILHALE